MSLQDCDFNDCRFLSIREDMVLFKPHSDSTVFFGNLNVECTGKDIYDDLAAVNKHWQHSSVRLKLRKGFAYAFVDFPTRCDAMKAVACFDCKYVSVDIEAIEQMQGEHHGHHGGKHKNGHKRGPA